MRAVAALVAIPLLCLAGLVGLAAPASAQAAPAELRLELADVAPHVVTADGPSALTVTGTLTNTGTTRVTDLVVRAQRGEPLGNEGQIRDALDGTATTDAVTPQFTPLASALAPGQQVPLRLTVPLRGAPQTSLALAGPGVHELLVNVNGIPDGATRARLAAVRMLLPVLSLPGADSAAPPARPVPFTVLYPITDVPLRLATLPGAPTLLANDTLATELAPGGRLGGLVSALARHAPPGSRVRAGVCLAVDPDLVETVSLMSAGYQVAGPGGTPVPGAGAAMAAQWLTQLRAVARGGCVVALPYADADIVALTRGGLPDTAGRAVTTGRDELAGMLQTPITPNVTWPAGGTLDRTTLGVVQRAGAATVVLSSEAVEQGRIQPPTATTALSGAPGPMTALLADPLLMRAAAGPAGPAAVPGRGSAAAATTPAGTDSPLALQDLIGTLAFRTGSDGPLVLAPPHYWAATDASASALLDAIDQMAGAGLLAPRRLAEVPPPGPGPAAQLASPVNVAADEVATAAIASLHTAAQDLADLRTAVVPDAGVGIGVDELFAPLETGLLRPASATRRADPVAARAAAIAELARVDAVRDSVRVLEPPSPYSLGTSDAPLPLTVVNGLPVTVRVRIDIASPAGLRVAPIEAQQIPPQGRRQVSVNAKVTRSGQFVVEAAVRTPDGGLLGPPSRLRVRSTAYGTITGWLTAIAGGILVLLAARRIWRRVRGEPAPLPELASTVPIPPVLAQPPAQQEPVPPAAVVAAPEDLAPPMEQVAGERPPAPPSTPMR